MRITQKRYEKSKKKLEGLGDCKQVVEMWENAIKRIGPVGCQKIFAINFDAEGHIMKTECEPAPSEIVAEEKGT